MFVVACHQVGYGDITATNVLEQVLCLVCMVIGVFVFTTVAAQLHSQLETAQAGQFEAEKKISKLVSFLKQRQVAPELRNQIRDFYVTKYRYQYTCGFDQEEMLHELPPTLARDLTEHLYAKYWQIETMKFWRILMFSRLDRRDQVALCKAFRSIFVGMNSSVYDQHDFGLGIFVVLRGKVMLTRIHGVLEAQQMLTDMQVSSNKEFAKLDDPTSKVAFSFTFDKGDCLGEVESVAELETDHSIPRYGDSKVTSIRGAELLSLDEEALNDFAVHHPELLKRFEEVARVREEKICQRLVHDLKDWTQFLFNVVLEQHGTDAAAGSSSSMDQVPRVVFKKYFGQIGTAIYNQDFITDDLLQELEMMTHQQLASPSGAAANEIDPSQNISREDIDNWLAILEDSVREILLQRSESKFLFSRLPCRRRPCCRWRLWVDHCELLPENLLNYCLVCCTGRVHYHILRSNTQAAHAPHAAGPLFAVAQAPKSPQDVLPSEARCWLPARGCWASNQRPLSAQATDALRAESRKEFASQSSVVTASKGCSSTFPATGTGC
eukprot:COSAG02_NODE_89_length_38500_cov_61.646910_13_plen_551_part_00